VRAPFVTGGMVAFGAGVAAIPALQTPWALAAAIAVTGIAQGVGAVATGAALGEAIEPAARGAAMGGYSTALYAGIAAGALLAGPVIARAGFGAGFAVPAVLLVIGAAAFHRAAGRAGRARPLP